MVASNGEPPARGQAPPVTIRLFVRPPVSDNRAVTIHRLSALKINDRIEGFDVQTVRGEVMLSEAGNDTSDDAAYWKRLVEWEDGGVRSVIDETRHTSRTGRTVRTVTPPELVLAVHVDDELECVFPCTDGEQTWTVTDFLDDLEAGKGLPTENPAKISTV